MGLRFVHAADLHLDSPFLGLGSKAPEHVGRKLLQATFDAYDNIIRLCIAEGAEALLVAGDIYDGADRSLRAQLKFVEGLKRLDGAGIRSFVCHGNHDPLDGWEARLAMPAGCHRFGPRVEAVPFDPANPQRAMVYGMSYPTQNVRDNIARTFVRANGSAFAIGLLHCNAGSDTGHEPYAPCTLDDLAASRMDYWALGHVHTRAVLRPSGPAVVYPGNPQGRHPNELGARGVYLVDVDNAGHVSLQFHAMDVVRWAAVEVSINRLEDEQALLNRLDSRLEEALGASDGRDLVCRVRFTGRGALHEWLQQRSTTADMLGHLNERWAGRTPFAWCERIEAATRPEFDRDRALQAGDFLSEVLAIADGLRSSSDALARLEEQLEPLYGHDRARRYLRDRALSPAALRELLDEAELECIERLGDAAS